MKVYEALETETGHELIEAIGIAVGGERVMDKVFELIEKAKPGLLDCTNAEDHAPLYSHVLQVAVLAWLKAYILDLNSDILEEHWEMRHEEG
jgi:hypothetical protein